MDLNYLLSQKKIRTDDLPVLVMRHVPTEPKLRKVLPWLAAERPELYNAYQRVQPPRAEKQLTKASYLVSCIGHEPKRALFVGVYKVSGWRELSFEDYWKIPENQEFKKLGMKGWSSESDRPPPLRARPRHHLRHPEGPTKRASRRTRCADGSYYVGMTARNLEARIAEHQAGAYDGYTALRRPVELVFQQHFMRPDDAAAAERQVKGWRRDKKEALIRGDFAALPSLARRGAKAVRPSRRGPLGRSSG